VDRDKLFDSSAVAVGDVMIGLPSSGLHSNGFSLVRKVFDVENGGLDFYCDDLGKTLGEALLEPTRIYVKPVLKLAESVTIKAVSHITGGGFYENIPRSLPQGVTACIDLNSIGEIPLFERIASAGNIPMRDMYNTFNMGIGMVLTVSTSQVNEAMHILKECGENPRVIGEIIPGDERVTLI
jgi:phosphoribosylformylglycinamidine cyclo-ligase